MKSNLKKKKFTPSTSKYDRNELRYKPLQFIDDSNRSYNAIKENISPDNDIIMNCFEEKSGILSHLFEEDNEKQDNVKCSFKTPSKYKIWVEDTPIDLYGLSLLERRKTKIKNN